MGRGLTLLSEENKPVLQTSGALESQKTLHASDRFEQLAQNAPVAIFIKDLLGRYTLANTLACKALGKAEVIGLRDNELLDDLSADRIRQHDLEVIESRKSVEYEECVQRGDFAQYYLAVKFPLIDDKGDVQGVCGVAVDITARREALEELQETREELERQWRLYNAILSSTPDLVYVLDLNHRFTYANEVLLEVWGKTWDEAIGKNCLELGYPAWHAAMHDRELDEVIRSKRPFKGEIPFTGAHGTRIYEYIFVPVLASNGEVEAVAGSTRDVTDRKRIEDSAREERERYRQLVESLPAAVYTCNRDGRIELFNDAAVKLWGRRPVAERDLWCGAHKAYRLDGRSLPVENSPLVRTLHEGRRIADEEFVLERPDGSRVHVISHPEPLFDQAGKLVGAINMLLDVTEQRRAERERALLAAIVSSSDDAIISMTLDGIITSWNRGGEKLFGYTAAEMIGKSIVMLIPEDRRDEESEIIDRIICHGERVEHFETVRISKRGTRIDVSLTVSPIIDSAGRTIGVSKVARDIGERIHAVHAVLESEQRFRILANHAPVGIFQTNLAGETTFVNQAWCQLAGLRPEEATGEGWINAVHPEDRDRVIRDWQFACSASLPSHTEFRFRRPDGSVAWLQGNAEPLRDSHGDMIGYIGTVADITARKIAEQALSDNERRLAVELANMNSLYELTTRLLATERLETALDEVLSSAMELQRADMGSVHLYDAVTGSFRIATQRGFDQDVLEDFVSRGFDPRSACGRALNSGTRAIIEDVRLDPDYKEFLPFAQSVGYRTVQSTPLISRSGTRLGLLSTHFREPRRFVARELRMLDLYARQAADFIEQIQMINAMREADHRKDEFLAMLSHELRNPLAPIRSGLDCLATEELQSSEVVDIMRDQVEHLVRLVDDLLDMSRIARGKIELRKEVLAAAPLVERAVDAIAWAFKAKHQSLEVSVPPEPLFLEADPVRIVQVLGNLLNNASKYTPEGGHIEFSLVGRDDQVVFQVTDNGIGIERELLPRVFDLFTQSTRALDRAQGGMGIGLTLVRRLVELHEGSVSAESEGVGRGSRFTIKLPASEHLPVRKSKPAHQPGEGRRILVVDDNFGAARLLTILLQKLGKHEIEVAYDGPSALDRLVVFAPELVLLDIGLPGMDGYEVARRMREIAKDNQLFLVALTGYGQPEDISKSKAAGFNEHLVKPPSVEMLQSLLARPGLRSTMAPQA